MTGISTQNRAQTRVAEIKPGEGGDDAAVFATELTHAIRAFAVRVGLTVTNQPGDGRTVLLALTGPPDQLDAVEALSGTHRIQRIPANSKQGRRHTSTATLTVLDTTGPEPVTVQDSDLIIQRYRGSGPGGQKKNKTSSAVRMRHIPSGIVVTREHGRSLTQNLDDARQDIQSRLAGQAAADTGRDLNMVRVAQSAGGGRAAKSWTHNTQRGTSVCHDTGRSWRLVDFLRGRLDG